jgi:hypothetical protein
MLENAVYFVAPPEFAASLTWGNPEQKHLAAKAMRVSAAKFWSWDAWTRSFLSHRAVRILILRLPLNCSAVTQKALA